MEAAAIAAGTPPTATRAAISPLLRDMGGV